MSKPIYVFGQIDVKDHKQYMNEYGLPTFEQLNKAGAKVLVATQNAVTEEGQGFGNWTILVKFDSEEAFSKQSDSEEYAVLKKLRIEKLTNGGNIFSMPGLG